MEIYDAMEDCPVKHMSLQTKLKQLVEDGVLEEKPVYRPGLGFGTCLLYDGTRIKVKRRFKGTPKWDHGMGANFTFKEPVDLAFCPKTKKLITFAKAI